MSPSSPSDALSSSRGEVGRGEHRKTNECILIQTPHILVILANNLKFSEGQWLSNCSSGPKKAREQETEDERALS